MRSRASTFLTKRHGALLTTSLAGQDTPHIIVLFQLTPLVQLLRNGKYECTDSESTRLVSKEVSYRWRTPTAAPINISDDFIAPEFAAALQVIKLGKAPLIIHAGAALKSWLCGFLSSLLRHLKIPKFWKRGLVVAIQKPLKIHKGPKELSSDLFAL